MQQPVHVWRAEPQEQRARALPASAVRAGDGGPAAVCVPARRVREPRPARAAHPIRRRDDRRRGQPFRAAAAENVPSPPPAAAGVHTAQTRGAGTSALSSASTTAAPCASAQRLLRRCRTEPHRRWRRLLTHPAPPQADGVHGGNPVVSALLAWRPGQITAGRGSLAEDTSLILGAHSLVIAGSTYSMSLATLSNRLSRVCVVALRGGPGPPTHRPQVRAAMEPRPARAAPTGRWSLLRLLRRRMARHGPAPRHHGGRCGDVTRRCPAPTSASP